MRNREYKGTALIADTWEDPEKIPFKLTATPRDGGKTWDLVVDRQRSLVRYNECHLPADRQSWEQAALQYIEDCFSRRIMTTISFEGQWVQ